MTISLEKRIQNDGSKAMAATVARSILKAVPTDAPEHHLKAIVLLGLAYSHPAVAGMCGVSETTVKRIATMYPDDVANVAAHRNLAMREISDSQVMKYQLIMEDMLKTYLSGKAKLTPQNAVAIGRAIESVYRIAHLLSLHEEAREPVRKGSEATARDIRKAKQALKAVRSDKAGMAPSQRAKPSA